MDGRNPPAPRRRLLTRGLAMIAGGLGLGLTAKVPHTHAAERAPRRDTSTTRTLTLYGRSWRMYGTNHRHGETPMAGDRLTTYGELLDSSGGASIGEFHAASFSTGSSFVTGSYAIGSVEIHTFNLRDGTIIGMGASTGGNTVFAVTGGTGRYLGAAGSYVARQDPSDLGGDGSAEFRFTFLTNA